MGCVTYASQFWTESFHLVLQKEKSGIQSHFSWNRIQVFVHPVFFSPRKNTKTFLGFITVDKTATIETGSHHGRSRLKGRIRPIPYKGVMKKSIYLGVPAGHPSRNPHFLHF